MKPPKVLIRVFAVLAVTAALTLAPSTAFADDFPGTAGPDVIVGTGGDDTIAGQGDNDSLNGDPAFDPAGGDDQIDGGDGNDSITGDNAFVGAGGDDEIDGGDGNDTITGDGSFVGAGGDDVIDGGDGDDTITGDGDFNGFGGDDEIDGGAGNDTIDGDGGFVGVGGDDVLNGGDGDDVINGDGFFAGVGGDDELYGGAGDDNLFGNGGNDLLCGGDGTDILNGQDGIDLGCAVDDEITVNAGVPGMLNLALNDDQLLDEGAGSDGPADEATSPLRYRLVSSSPGILGAVIDAITGVLTFTATQSGTVDYEVYRAFNGNDIIVSLATVFITVPVVDEPVVPGDDESGEVAPEETALLPDTGAGDSLTQGAVAAALILVGIGLLMAGRRKSGDREPLTEGPALLSADAEVSVLDDSADQVLVMTQLNVVAVRECNRQGVRLVERSGERTYRSHTTRVADVRQRKSPHLVS